MKNRKIRVLLTNADLDGGPKEFFLNLKKTLEKNLNVDLKIYDTGQKYYDNFYHKLKTNQVRTKVVKN